MSKQIFSKEAARVALQVGVNKIADPVGSTMGPGGKTVIISNHYNLDPVVTKDGVTVAGCIILPDPRENVGAKLIQKACQSTAKEAGDGTTQTAVLAQSMINNGLEAISKGTSPQKMKVGIDKAVACVVSAISAMAKKVEDNDTIKNIATISANNDEKIGGMIAEAYLKIGHQGVMVIENSNTIETKIEVVDGVEIPKGFISPDFVNDKAKQRVVYEDPLFLVADQTINTAEELHSIFEQLAKANELNRAIIIIATDFEGEAFSTMLVNFRQGNLKVCLVKPPAQYRREHLDDIAFLTGAKIISDENGIKVKNALRSHLGGAAKVIITENSTTIVGGKGDFAELELHKNAIRIQRDEYKGKSDELMTLWDQRLARISGSICVIKVGGATEVEAEERKMRVDDACRAVKSSIEEGVVIGGGTALFKCRAEIVKIVVTDPDELVGISVVMQACEAPIRKMMENSGGCTEENIKLFAEKLEKVDFGLNIKTNTYENLWEAGVIDPAKVIRCAIQNAASVACLSLTSDYLLVEM